MAALMPEDVKISAEVPEAMNGQRLDHALELLAPDLGLRARKRLWETHEVLVDGRPRPKGYLISTGQTVELRALPGAGAGPGRVSDWPGLRVVGQKTGVIAALFKPAGLPTEAIAGRSGPSLEAFLPEFWPGLDVLLVNRLDTAASGLVLAALAPEVASDYRGFENQGLVRKEYLLLVYGRLERPDVLRGRIDAANRARVRVLDEPDPDELRRTEVVPLHYLEALNATLVRAVIFKGARHQIRAHLAHAGHPVVGDQAYGQGGPGGLYLHHAAVRMPEYFFQAPPAWPEWPEWSGLPGVAPRSGRD